MRALVTTLVGVTLLFLSGDGNAQKPPRGNVSGEGDFPVRMTAVLKGISKFDAVSLSKTIGGDDKGDGLFVLSIQAHDKEITEIAIRGSGEVSAMWDTLPNSGNPAVGIALVSDPVRLLNRRDASLSIPVKGKADFNLYVADNNNAIAGGKTDFRIAVTFSDGEIAWCDVQRPGQPSTPLPSQESTTYPPPLTSKVHFLATWLGYVSTDAVGPYPGLKPDGKADAVFGLDIEVSPKTYITGIEINSIAGDQRRWGTTGALPGSWGLGVAYQSAHSALLNKPDGSIRIPIDKRVQFFLYAADPGDLSKTYDRLRVIVHLADGNSYQQLVKRPPGTTSSVVPGVEEPPKTKGLIECEFRGFTVDLVNMSTRPGKDRFDDGTFVLRLDMTNKKLIKIDLAETDVGVRWSSDPKPPLMFLGVALYPKIHTLVNEKGGALNIPLTGRRALYLYAADNGRLSDPRSHLTVTVTFSDKTVLSTEVLK